MRLRFFFFLNVSEIFVENSSIPPRRIPFRHAIFPSNLWREKRGQTRLPSRSPREYFEDDTSIRVNFIFLIFFKFIYLLFAARSSQLALFQLACSPHSILQLWFCTVYVLTCHRVIRNRQDNKFFQIKLLFEVNSEHIFIHNKQFKRFRDQGVHFMKPSEDNLVYLFGYKDLFPFSEYVSVTH